MLEHSLHYTVVQSQNSPKNLLDPQPKPILLQLKPLSKLTRQPRSSRHDKRSRNQTNIIRHLLDIFHLFLFHDLEGFLRGLFHACLVRGEGFGFAYAGECRRSGGEEAG
jgi:hypothetical protein